MEVSGQTQAPAALSPGKRPPVPIVQGAVWAPEPFYSCPYWEDIISDLIYCYAFWQVCACKVGYRATLFRDISSSYIIAPWGHVMRPTIHLFCSKNEWLNECVRGRPSRPLHRDLSGLLCFSVLRTIRTNCGTLKYSRPISRVNMVSVSDDSETVSVSIITGLCDECCICTLSSDPDDGDTDGLWNIGHQLHTDID
jgi:hypothetical protein